MDIAIIGGGASGMILASKLKNESVTLFERNSKLGKKLLLTGNGKCNFTNADFKDLDTIYNNEFARNVYKRYDSLSFIKYFKEIGIIAKSEKHRGIDYIYPNSNKSTSVVYNLLDKIISNGVIIKYDSLVKKINKMNDKFILYLANGENYSFDKIVISTGGNSYQNTGSDGNGYNLAKSLGHSVINPLPGLCALKYSDTDIKKVKGVRVDATLYSDFIGFKETGEIQFTEFGISGIPVFNISRHLAHYAKSDEKNLIFLDFYIDDSKDYNSHFISLISLLRDRRKDLKYKRIRDFLCGFLPDDISEIILNRSNISAKNIEDLSDEELNRIAKNIVMFKITVVGTSGFESSQITIGGVNTKEVKLESLESKLVNGLYFTGEILDIDGKCGGYNLQLSYSSASIVANSIRG